MTEEYLEILDEIDETYHALAKVEYPSAVWADLDDHLERLLEEKASLEEDAANQ